jgi:hypothetical protein
MLRCALMVLTIALVEGFSAKSAHAIDGATLRVNGRNGWRAFEIISVNNNPANDGINYAMPGTFDGIGAWLPDPSTLRILVNHETGDGSVSEVNVNLQNFKTAIENMRTTGNLGGITYVNSAQQAYDRWSSNGGVTWIDTSNASNTSFGRFCSSQSYLPNTFGPDRGFVDNIYITGEEGGTNRIFAIDMANRDFYQLSGVVGRQTGVGLPGLPFDSLENAALVDTGETNHVALLLSPDGGTQRMQLYIGEKGKGLDGSASNDFLARNGLAWGSYFYLNDALPNTGVSTDGFFDTTLAGALNSTKLEDVDTSPGDPTKVLLGDEDSGAFVFDFNLDFSSGAFNAATSSFSLVKVLTHNNDRNGAFGDADNVDWTAPTTLNGVSYPEGLILVNEDSGTGIGETWIARPDGSELTLIADLAGMSGAQETSGVLDISGFVGYNPGSIVLVSNMGSNSSMTALINPAATPVPEPATWALFGVGCALVAWIRRSKRGAA